MAERWCVEYREAPQPPGRWNRMTNHRSRETAARKKDRAEKRATWAWSPGWEYRIRKLKRDER